MCSIGDLQDKGSNMQKPSVTGLKIINASCICFSQPLQNCQKIKSWTHLKVHCPDVIAPLSLLIDIEDSEFPVMETDDPGFFKDKQRGGTIASKQSYVLLHLLHLVQLNFRSGCHCHVSHYVHQTFLSIIFTLLIICVT